MFKPKRQGYSVDMEIVAEHQEKMPLVKWAIELDMGGPCRFEWSLPFVTDGIHFEHNQATYSPARPVLWVTAIRNGRA